MPIPIANMSGSRRGDTGAIGEMLVAVDLLRRGFATFRAVSPSSPCDLVALVDGVCWRVEVRTGTRYPSTMNVGVPLRPGQSFDVLAVVVGDDIGYLPESFLGEPFPFIVTDAVRAKVRISADIPSAVAIPADMQRRLGSC